MGIYRHALFFVCLLAPWTTHAAANLYENQEIGFTLQRPESWLFDHELPDSIKMRLGAANTTFVSERGRKGSGLLKQIILPKTANGHFPTIRVEFFDQPVLAAFTPLMMAEQFQKKFQESDPNFVQIDGPKNIEVAGREAGFLEVEYSSVAEPHLKLPTVVNHGQIWFFKVNDALLKITFVCLKEEWPQLSKNGQSTIDSLRFLKQDLPAPAEKKKTDEVLDGLKF